MSRTIRKAKIDYIYDMLQAGASLTEAEKAYTLFQALRIGMKVKKNGRIDTAYGDKTPLGFYRMIVRILGGGL